MLDLEGREDIKLSFGLRDQDGTWIVRPESDEPPEVILERVGRVPIPPYIRGGQMVESDRERYQTVYARNPGSVAAPTAGLHFTERLLQELRETGIELCWVTLHIGLGTFKPITTPSISDYQMHSEWGKIDEPTVNKILACRQRGKSDCGGIHVSSNPGDGRPRRLVETVSRQKRTYTSGRLSSSRWWTD